MDKEDVANLVDPPDKSVDQCINAVIMAGVNFFTTLGALGATGLLANLQIGLLAGFISAGSTFFATLAMQRGLMKKPEE